MLIHLEIQNYALIQNLQLTPKEGLNIITGETGAGKSILLGALGLLMGQRADVKTLLDDSQKCIIEGHFELSKKDIKDFFNSFDLDYETTCIIRREINPSGKSRAFINDVPVTLDILKELSDKLIDVHSQNETISLGGSGYQLDYLDTFAGINDLLNAYKSEYNRWVKAKKALENLIREEATFKKEYEFNLFLFEELEKAQPRLGEKEEAEQELTVLENAEEVKARLSQTLSFFQHPELSILNQLRDSAAHLQPIVAYSEKYKELKERIASVLIELDDISADMEDLLDRVDVDQNRLEALKERVDLLFRLFQKHGVQSEKELLEIRDNLDAKIALVQDVDAQKSKMEKEVKDSYNELRNYGLKIREKRKAICPKLTEAVEFQLRELGIEYANLEISLEEKEPDSTGIDLVQFLFSANKGVAPQALKNVASGGEFSRLMLVLKYFLAQKKALPSIIFDEIDTGVSGEIAVKMGNLLLKMGAYLQVIAITHLHQIAGKGKTHFYVYKNNSGERTVSHIKEIQGNERVLEIAKMIGGAEPSESAIKNALELLEK